MSNIPDTVIDEGGTIHHLLKEPLGRGGQGVVLRTRNSHIAVKLIGRFSEDDSDENTELHTARRLWNKLTHVPAIHLIPDGEKHDALRQRLDDVRALPLPLQLHVAEPLAMLRDHVGYTMGLLKDMVPMRTLIAEPGTPKLAQFYRETGGLGRRLQLLANIAGLLARLHAVPLVYADLSPNNVFISEQADANEVWLIDLDNLDYLSSNATSIFTPGFGAPEVVTGRAGVSTLSDCYAFAVLAFWVLAQIHPFLGDYVDEGGWDEDEDREDLAFRGELPWVEDQKHTENHTEKGIARHLVMSKPVRELFERTFEAGRKDRTKRPSMAEWAETLRRAADRIVSCPNCGSTFDVTAGSCPFCIERPQPSFIHMQVNRWDPDFDGLGASAVSPQAVWHKMLSATEDSVIHRHVVEPVLADAEDQPVLRIRILRSGIAVEALSMNHEVHVVVGDRVQRIERETKLPMPKAGAEAYLHFGPLFRPHRMAVLRLREGA